MIKKLFWGSVSIVALSIVPLFAPVHSAHAAASTTLTGTIEWTYTRITKSQVEGVPLNATEVFKGKTNAVLIRTDHGTWEDNGSSTYSGTYTNHATIGRDNNICTIDASGAADNLLYAKVRDDLIAQGQSSSWIYGFSYPPLRGTKVQFTVHPGYVPGQVLVSKVGLPPNCPDPSTGFFEVFPPYAVGQGGVFAGGFIGNIVGAFTEAPTVDFNYHATSTSNGGEITEDMTVTGAVSNKPVAAFSYTNKNDGVLFDASSSTPLDDLQTYEWVLGDGTFISTSSPTLLHQFSETNRDYTVTLVVINSNNVRSEPNTQNIHVANDKPVADFTSLIHSGGRVEFDASVVSNKPVASYAWTFDDGSPVSTVNGDTQEHTYTDFRSIFTPFKKYQVKLVVTDVNGNVSDPVTHEVDVCAPDLPATSGFDYAGLVRCAEIAQPDKSPTEILDFMRKMYYGNDPWSLNKIWVWNDVIPCGTIIQAADPGSVLNDKLRTALIQSTHTIPSLDISHIFTVLEAMECPTKSVSITPPPMAGVKIQKGVWDVKMPNYSFAGWGGDVGSAAAQKTSDELHGNFRDWPVYFATPGSLASAEDLNGDIDGLVIGFTAGGSSCTQNIAPPSFALSLSDTIRNYYPDPEQPLQTPPAYQNRLNCFIDSLGLHGSKTLPASLAGQYDGEIYEFAQPWYYKQNLSSSFAVDPNKQLKDYSLTVANMFGTWLGP
jgi:hypothetical protein